MNAPSTSLVYVHGCSDSYLYGLPGCPELLWDANHFLECLHGTSGCLKSYCRIPGCLKSFCKIPGCLKCFCKLPGCLKQFNRICGSWLLCLLHHPFQHLLVHSLFGFLQKESTGWCFQLKAWFLRFQPDCIPWHKSEIPDRNRRCVGKFPDCCGKNNSSYSTKHCWHW